MTKWQIWLSWLVIVGLGVALRFWQLGNVPVGTYWDETAILLDSHLLAETGQDMHGLSFFQAIFPSYGDYKLPAYIWLATASVKMFGPTAWALRLPSALIGIATILLAGGLVKQFLQKILPVWQTEVLALATGLILATSPWSIQFSRTAFEGHVGQFLVGLAVYFWLLGQKKPHWLILSGVVSALAVYAYYSVRFVWPVLLLALNFGLSWQLLQKNSLTQKNQLHLMAKLKSFSIYLIPKLVVNLILPGLIFGLLLWPLANSPWANQADKFRLSADSVMNMQDWPVISNQYRELAGDQSWDRVFYHRDWLMLRELAQNYVDHLDFNYLFFVGDANLRHGTGRVGLFYWWGLLALPAGMYWWLRNHPQGLLVIIAWWLVALLPASVPETTPHALRSLNALIPITLLLAAGVFSLSHSLWQCLDKLKLSVLLTKFSLGLALCLIFVWPIKVYAADYFGDYQARSVVAWQGGYTELANKILAINQLQATTWILTGDQKFYLWLMLEANKAQIGLDPKIESDFLFKQLGPYHLNVVDWFEVVYSQEPMLVVMGTADLEQQITERKLEPSWVIKSKTYSAQLPYSIAAFRWPAEMVK